MCNFILFGDGRNNPPVLFLEQIQNRAPILVVHMGIQESGNSTLQIFCPLNWRLQELHALPPSRLTMCS